MTYLKIQFRSFKYRGLIHKPASTGLESFDRLARPVTPSFIAPWTVGDYEQRMKSGFPGNPISCSVVGRLEENEIVKNSRLTDKVLEVFFGIANTNVKNGQFLSEFSSKLAVMGGKAKDMALIARALSVAEEIVEPYHKAKALAAIASHIAVLGEKEESINLLKRSLSVTKRISDQYYRAKALAGIVHHIAALDEKEEAITLIERSLSITEEISESAYRSDALIAMTSHIAVMGDKEAAMALTERARDIAVEIPDPYYKTITLAAIAVHIAALGDKRAAMTLIKKACDAAAEISSSFYKAKALAKIAAHIAALGDKRAVIALTESACDIAVEISDSSYKAEALTDIASNVVILGEKMNDPALGKKAFKIIISISDSYNKDKAMAVLASRIAAWGEKANDLALIESALDISRKEIEAPYHKSNALAALSSHIAALGRKTNNLALLKKASDIAEEITEPSFKARALADIASNLIVMGDKETAMALAKRACDIAAEEISYSEYRDRALVYIVSCIAASGEETEDLDLLKRAIAIEKNISGPSFKAEALAVIASHMVALGENEEAIVLLERAIPFADEISSVSLKDMRLAEIHSVLIPLGTDFLNKETIEQSLKRSFSEIPQDLIDVLSKLGATLFLAFSHKYLKVIRREEFEANNRIMEDPGLALVLSLFLLKSEDDIEVSEKDILTMLNLLSPEQSKRFARKLFEFPELARSITFRLVRLEKIALEYGGDSLATYPEFARVLLNCPVVLNNLSAEKAVKEDREALRNKSLEEILEESGIAELKFDQAFGRTLLFRGKNDEYLALKLLIERESVDKHRREEKMLRYSALRRKALGLESDYPVPIGVFNIARIDPEHDQALLKVTQEDKSFKVAKNFKSNYPYTALVYRFNGSSYFTYSNHEKLSQEEFERSSYRVLGDLFGLAQDNLMHIALIELFHNLNPSQRPDLGRYLWMVDLVGPLYSRTGPGRLHGWTRAVRFPNLRESGLADLADTSSLEDLMKADNSDSVHLLGLQRFEEKAVNYYRANYFGEYLLGWTLVVGSRYLKLELLDWQDSQKIDSLAGILHGGFDHAFSVYTGIPKEKVHAFLGSIIDWERMARQMSYFMTGAYIEGLKRRCFPEGIFDEQVEIKIPNNVEKSQGWTDMGWSLDGKNPDLGPFNGPFPLQELVRALYLSTGFMVALYREDSTAARS